MSEKYPNGKLNENDEGQLTLAILIENKKVIIDFSKEIRWIGFDKNTAIEFANMLLNKACEIDNLCQ